MNYVEEKMRLELEILQIQKKAEEERYNSIILGVENDRERLRLTSEAMKREQAREEKSKQEKWAAYSWRIANMAAELMMGSGSMNPNDVLSAVDTARKIMKEVERTNPPEE